jgi:hypothetical protein
MRVTQWLNVLALVVVLAVNGLANALPLNGMTTGDLSDNLPNLFTPAGYVFSIWGLIYLALIGFAVYQALPAQKEAPFQERIGWWFVASCVFNVAWLFAWHYELIPLSLVFMLALLGSLLAIYLRLDIGRREVSRAESWLVNVPFGIYLGWISVATIANVTTTLVSLDWQGFGLAPEIWTVLVLIVGAALAVAMIFLRREVAFPLVVVWAFAGIVVKQTNNPVIAATAGLLAAAVFLVLVLTRLMGGRSAGAAA